MVKSNPQLLHPEQNNNLFQYVLFTREKMDFLQYATQTHYQKIIYLP